MLRFLLALLLATSAALTQTSQTDTVLSKLDQDLDTLLSEQFNVRSLPNDKAAPAFVPPTSFLQSMPEAPVAPGQPAQAGQPAQPFYDPLLLGMMGFYPFMGYYPFYYHPMMM